MEQQRSQFSEILHKGNVRHLVVEKDGRRAADVPLTIVVIAAILAIWAVGILIVVAVAMGYTVHVEDTEALHGVPPPVETPPTVPPQPES